MSRSLKILSILSTLSLMANSPMVLAQGLVHKAGSGSSAGPGTLIAQQEMAGVVAPPAAAAAASLGRGEAAAANAGKSEAPNATAAQAKSKDKKAKLSNSAYIKEEPKSDPAGSNNRVHRPGKDGSMPPLAPGLNSDSSASVVTDSPLPLLTPPPPAPAKERFPSVGQLEKLMFGHSTPNIFIDNRLDKLETAIFQKNAPDLDIEQRIKRLKEVIIGEEPATAHSGMGSPAYSDPLAGPSTDTAYMPPSTTFPSPKSLGMTLPDLDKPPAAAPYFPNYERYDLNQQLSISEAEKFAVDVLNEVRQQQGLPDLVWDEQAFHVADEQVDGLVKRDAVSHQNAGGENPDVRYSKAGGADSLVESTMMFPSADKLHPTRELVVKILEALNGRQDDRDALMYPHASGFSMAFKWSPDRRKLFCCTEVVTKHGQMDPLPTVAMVGDKVEVRGTVTAPYRFQKITLAWEGLPSPPDDTAETAEALPYFPPLDYEAHAVKSNKDFDKGVKILQIAGITAAIAGGLFVPPVALAAPLIAASISTPTPKAVSEIPIKGGVKSDGQSFSRSITLNNQGKEGIYYVTVWASPGTGDESIAVSRRAIIATKAHPESESGKSGDGKTDNNEAIKQEVNLGDLVNNPEPAVLQAETEQDKKHDSKKKKEKHRGRKSKDKAVSNEVSRNDSSGSAGDNSTGSTSTDKTGTDKTSTDSTSADSTSSGSTTNVNSNTSVSGKDRQSGKDESRNESKDEQKYKADSADDSGQKASSGSL